MQIRTLALPVLLMTALAGCSKSETPPSAPAASTAPAAAPAPAAPAVPMSALPKVDGDAILQRIKVMSSDKFQGRAPGTVGEEITVGYLESQFKDLGLAPGNPDGTYIQKVPLVGITGSATTPLTFSKGSEKLPLKW